VTFFRLAAAAAGFLLAAPLHAQEVSFRLGGLHAQYADSIRGDAGLVGARLSWSTERMRSVLDASWAEYDGGNGVGQVWGSTDLIALASRRAALGFHLDGVLNAIRLGPTTLTGTAEVFGAAVTGPLLLAVGLDAGGVRRLDGARRPFGAAVIRARWSVRRWSATAELSATASDTIRYQDASLSLQWRGRRVNAGALVGGRAGDLTRHPWAQGWASAELTRRISLEFAAGGYPRELSGFDRGRYLLAGLRVRFGRASTGGLLARRNYEVLRRAGTAGLDLERLDSGRVAVTFRLAADSGAPAIAGDWNEWVPSPLTPAGPDTWRAVLTLTPGTHRFALVLPGGRWIVPPGVTKLPDDFGGEVGLLVVP